LKRRPHEDAQRSSAGDPARTLALLWRDDPEAPRRPGPRRGRSVDEIVGAAVELADAEGLDAVSIRRVAQGLRAAPMSLYTYVPGKAELLDLMLDAVYREMPFTDTRGRPWRERVAAIAHDNLALFDRHPWAATVSTVRPPLGPGLLAKYERELQAFEGLGLDDLEIDDALSYVLTFVRGIAIAQAEIAASAAASSLTDAQWWEVSQPLLARVATPGAYPTAARVGTAAGQARGTTFSPRHAFAFGLERVLDGLAALIGGRSDA
jgi:AcrR family transcriptional regulator